MRQLFCSWKRLLPDVLPMNQDRIVWPRLSIIGQHFNRMLMLPWRHHIFSQLLPQFVRFLSLCIYCNPVLFHSQVAVIFFGHKNSAVTLIESLFKVSLFYRVSGTLNIFLLLPIWTCWLFYSFFLGSDAIFAKEYVSLFPTDNPCTTVVNRTMA